MNWISKLLSNQKKIKNDRIYLPFPISFFFLYITCGYFLIIKKTERNKNVNQLEKLEDPYLSLSLLNSLVLFVLSPSLPLRFFNETLNILNSWTSLYRPLSHIFLLFIYSFPRHSLFTPFSWFPFIMEDASGNQLFFFICCLLNYQKGFLFSKFFLVWVCSAMI